MATYRQPLPGGKEAIIKLARPTILALAEATWMDPDKIRVIKYEGDLHYTVEYKGIPRGDVDEPLEVE